MLNNAGQPSEEVVFLLWPRRKSVFLKIHKAFKFGVWKVTDEWIIGRANRVTTSTGEVYYAAIEES